jgi:hypothetical protein
MELEVAVRIVGHLEQWLVDVVQKLLEVRQ